jgi:hypothetical protein
MFRRLQMRARLTVILLLILVGSVSGQSPQTKGAAPATTPPGGVPGGVPPGIGGAPPGVPAPSPAEAAKIAEVMAFEKKCDEAAVQGDVAFLERALSKDFVMTHGDAWTSGGSPLKVDTKASWLEYVAKKPGPYVYRRLDSVQVEVHGDFALTVGRYKYLPRSTRPTTSHLYVWFERAYAKHNGEWQFLSHRTVKGPVREDDDAKSTGTR